MHLEDALRAAEQGKLIRPIAWPAGQGFVVRGGRLYYADVLSLGPDLRTPRLIPATMPTLAELLGEWVAEMGPDE